MGVKKRDLEFFVSFDTKLMHFAERAISSVFGLWNVVYNVLIVIWDHSPRYRPQDTNSPGLKNVIK